MPCLMKSISSQLQSLGQIGLRVNADAGRLLIRREKEMCEVESGAGQLKNGICTAIYPLDTKTEM